MELTRGYEEDEMLQKFFGVSFSDIRMWARAEAEAGRTPDTFVLPPMKAFTLYGVKVVCGDPETKRLRSDLNWATLMWKAYRALLTEAIAILEAKRAENLDAETGQFFAHLQQYKDSLGGQHA